jgi:hypothetical protein
MFKVQSHQSFLSLRMIAFIVLAGCAVAAASLIGFRNSQNVTVALPTGLLVPIAVDPQQMMREKRNLPAQPVSDFSLIFPEN